MCVFKSNLKWPNAIIRIWRKNSYDLHINILCGRDISWKETTTGLYFHVISLYHNTMQHISAAFIFPNQTSTTKKLVTTSGSLSDL